ncbi:divergent polysaccharide deacetylase family protein [Paenibacillus polymyxa]|uniref:Divergent polysaccharide deacetylase family protein n=1 Tax=Paenibacillus polymyxa TaxID=1406 RepID=A0AAP4E8S0_PAEPO|nr:divergent polysaccharide deacetylase family protein [Paenibacillus polymyxa]AHC19429.1 sugar deacetylase [Paenibacillus polymyxa CR1]MDH2329688.1 divergent polysaccharide deacetylase family protein [Paenibacillus polymyxa]
MSTRRKLHMRNIIKKALKASRGRKEPAYVPVFHSSSKIRRSVVLCISVCMLFMVCSTGVAKALDKQDVPQKMVAVIIDDLGNNMKGTEQILNLPVKITVAVMPFLPTTKQDAMEAHKRGHDVIVHLPMEPKQGKPEWLGPGAIKANMTDEEVRAKVTAAIKDVPYAIGMNNHMGSKVTSDKRIMSIVLDVCKEHGLFFVDSRTNYWSVVPELAAKKGMPPVRNDVFLDDVHTLAHVNRQLTKVVEWLDEHDTCVTIGHVGVSGMYTSSALHSSVPKLKEHAKFVGISDLVRAVWGWTGDPATNTTMPSDAQ